MRRSILVAALGLLAAGCSEPGDRGPADRAEDAGAVYEAVFRYHLQKLPTPVRAYLTVDGQDPPADLLKRLRRDWPNLQPASAEPKEKGLRVYVKSLKWIDQDTAEMNAGHWFPTKYAGEGYFGDHRVVRHGERWVVEEVTNEVMS